MTTIVNVQDAKTRLSELLRRVEAGEQIVIARAGTPIARIEAASPPKRQLDRPLLPELPPIPTDSLFGDLPDSELAAWEGGGAGDPLGETAP
ncbi:MULTISPECIES: type II toxin-antitoxin system Phd/YefM family antitoxin [Microbacterium]|uniref:Antitoxin n=1 Tax=Microbacterium resistens TaxID=156977 RepID=A0ABY3RU87_9MICO|nr:type II toxin-antitoxin system prevent-host-death family antitoxin [Microbacterium resistens]MDA4893064.1 type II toxin-antitoxin system prevent-host-death family antitoxin [Streptomyces sp. MS2A]UGS26475.1 type II toxin-antitoxin system prevent-host-death family antitoxin [Microbacterium resistens]